MYRKIIKFILLAVILIIVASCKTKHSVTKFVSTDSTENVKIDEVTNQKVHLIVRYPNKDNMEKADSFGSNLLLIPLLHSADNRPSSCIPFVPGMEIDYQFDLVQNKKADKKTKVKTKGTDKQIITQPKKNSCHVVIWMLLFAVFICLVVRFRKKIAEIFGWLRKNIYLRSVKGDDLQR